MRTQKLFSDGGGTRGGGRTVRVVLHHETAGRAKVTNRPVSYTGLFAASHRYVAPLLGHFSQQPGIVPSRSAKRIRRISTRSLQIYRRLRRPTESLFPLRDLDLSHSAGYFSRWNTPMEPRSLEVPTSTPSFVTSSTHEASVIHPLRGESMTLVEGKISFFISRSSSSLCH